MDMLQLHEKGPKVATNQTQNADRHSIEENSSQTKFVNIHRLLTDCGNGEGWKYSGEIQGD
jgi:hypothetical protein